MKHTKLNITTIPDAVTAEMRRLAEIHPLLSPTAGWPKLKGLHSVQTRIHLMHLTKAEFALMNANPLWSLEQNPKLRAEAKRALRGLLGEAVKLATDVLRPAGWKPKVVDQSESNHVAMLWTRKGRELAFLAYLKDEAPSIAWVNTKLSKQWRPSNKNPNAYGDNAVIVLAAQNGAQATLKEVCAALDKHMHTPRKDRPRDSALEVSGPQQGMAQVHICLGRENALPPQHRKLVEALRNRVCFVGFESHLGSKLPEMPTKIIRNAPRHTFGAEEAWAGMCSGLTPGSIRLVAVDGLGLMKWCETFGPDETVPKATIKRLLASSHPRSPAEDVEQKAIYRSLKTQ